MSENKFTVLTGACGGLGQAFSKELVSAGNNLIITGTSQAKIDAFIAELKKINPKVCVLGFVMNLSSEDSIASFVEELTKLNVEVNRLINNAGLIVEGGFLDLSESQVLNAIKINCLGTVSLTRKMLKAFEIKEILTTSSLGGFYPMPQMSTYAATKSFLEKFMASLHEELKPQKIKVSVLCPGGIPTTAAMKDAIISQGVGGKLTAKSPEYIAKYALKKLKNNKTVIIPGFANRFVRFISRFCGEAFLAHRVNKMWQKANKKRTVK